MLKHRISPPSGNYYHMTEIKFKKLHPKAMIPRYAHGPNEDAGLDLCAVEDMEITPHEPTLVKTGLAIEMPPGIEGQVRPRSGLALNKGVTVYNSPGTLDPSYRGDIGVILWWAPLMQQLEDLEDEYFEQGKRLTQRDVKFKVKAGDKIAQLVLARYERIKAVWDQDLAESKRGVNGFGSTDESS